MRSFSGVAIDSFRFHTRGATGADTAALFSYSEAPTVLGAISKKLHHTLGLTNDAHLVTGGSLHALATFDADARRDVAYDVIGVRTFGDGDALLVSAVVHGPEGVVAWTPDLDVTAPGKPLDVAHYRRLPGGQFSLAPLGPELRSEIMSLARRLAPTMRTRVVSMARSNDP